MNVGLTTNIYFRMSVLISVIRFANDSPEGQTPRFASSKGSGRPLVFLKMHLIYKYVRMGIDDKPKKKNSQKLLPFIIN